MYAKLCVNLGQKFSEEGVKAMARARPAPTLRLKPWPFFELLIVWYGRFWIPGEYHTY